MGEIYTAGRWRPAAGKEDAFVEAWTEFAAWASRMPGAGTLLLARDVRTDGVFLSFGAWESIDGVRAWKENAEFRDRIRRVVQHVDEFEPSELAVVATVDSGAVSRSAPVAAPVHAAADGNGG